MSSSSAGKARKKPEALALQNFNQRVLRIVRNIPRGKVLTYGQVAALAGVPRASRIVGGILYRQGPLSRLPWQRVLNSHGMISTYRIGFGEEQRRLLEREGIRFDASGAMELGMHQWWPSNRILKSLEISEDLARSLNLRMDF